MTSEQKHEITELLRQRKTDLELSLKEIATMSKVGSEATLSDILNNKWVDRDHIHDRVWNKLGAWLGFHSWVVAPTTNHTIVTNVCKFLKRIPQAMALVDEPGMGKSQGIDHFSKNNKGVYVIKCTILMTRKDFLKALLQAIGKSDEGKIGELMISLCEELNKITKPVIILDEADKLKDGVFELFNPLYNETQDHCSWLAIGAPHLEKRIQKGVRNNKQSFKEIYSRIGGEFQRLKPITIKDITSVCKANGVEDAMQIQRIFNQCQNDMRRVKALIRTYKLGEEMEVSHENKNAHAA